MKYPFYITLAITLLLAGCAPKEQKVMARFVPERADDFVFENNLIAGRFYGKALEGNPTSPGVDIWVKLPGKLVADEWYAADREEPGYYHRDHGGKDCYKVAVSLGGGASAPYVNETIYYPATNYRSYEMLFQKPDEVSFVLHYPEWEAAEGIRVALDKKITVKADSYFVRVDDNYTFSGTDTLAVVAGIKLHGNAVNDEENKVCEFHDAWTIRDDRIAIWEPASDTSVEPEDSRIGVAVVMPGADLPLARIDLDHLMLCKTLRPGETLTYWFGNCWSKGDIQSAQDWFDLVWNL